VILNKQAAGNSQTHVSNARQITQFESFCFELLMSAYAKPPPASYWARAARMSLIGGSKTLSITWTTDRPAVRLATMTLAGLPLFPGPATVMFPLFIKRGGQFMLGHVQMLLEQFCRAA
jgi:hypothetical protein